MTLKRTALKRSTKPMKQTPLKRKPMKQSKPSIYARRPDTGEPAWAKGKELVKERSGGHCEGRTVVCQGRASTVHHRKLRKQGGTHHPWNLLHLCHPCHQMVHAEPEYAYSRGLMVRSWQDPRAIAHSGPV